MANPDTWLIIKQLRNYARERIFIPITSRLGASTPCSPGAKWKAGLTVALFGIPIAMHFIADYLDDGEINCSVFSHEIEQTRAVERSEKSIDEPKTNITDLGQKVDNLEQAVTDLQDQQIQQQFETAWDGLNDTIKALNPIEINNTIAEAKLILTDYSRVFEQIQIDIRTLDKIVNKPEQYTQSISENLTKAKLILNKKAENVTEREINSLRQIKTNLSNLEKDALNIDLITDYETAFSNLEQNCRKFEDLENQIQKYKQSEKQYNQTLQNKTSEKQTYVHKIRELEKIDSIYDTIRQFNESFRRYQQNLTELNRTLFNFESKPVAYEEADIETLEARLQENISSARKTIKDISQKETDWWDSGVTRNLEVYLFSSRYDNLTREQQELFLNRTQKKKWTDGNSSNGEIVGISLYFPNDPSKKYKAIFELASGDKTVFYDPSTAPDIKTIFNYLIYGAIRK